MKASDLIDMNELENALAIVKNATDILIEESELRRESLHDYLNSDEQQYLYNREQDGDAVEIIAFMEIVKAGDFDIRRDLDAIYNREEQIQERIRLKAESLRTTSNK
jgi:hypothetical protein